MSPAPRRKDLVVLAADKNTEFTVRGLLDSRTAALGIRRVVFDVYPHPERDPGCRWAQPRGAPAAKHCAGISGSPLTGRGS
jgi:hypothetical protein